MNQGPRTFWFVSYEPIWTDVGMVKTGSATSRSEWTMQTTVPTIQLPKSGLQGIAPPTKATKAERPQN